MKKQTIEIIANLAGSELNLEVVIKIFPYKPAVIKADPNDCTPEEPMSFSMCNILDLEQNLTGLTWLYYQDGEFTDAVDKAVYTVLENEQ